MSESTEDLDLDMQAVVQAATEFSLLDRQEKALAKRKKELRDRLYGLVEIEGQEDEKGNLLLPLPSLCGDIQALQLQRRVSRPLNAELAEEILKSIVMSEDSGEETYLWDDCVEWVAVLDESKVMAAHYDGLLTEEQVDQMFPEVESFAFSPVRVGKARR